MFLINFYNNHKNIIKILMLTKNRANKMKKIMTIIGIVMKIKMQL